MDTSTSLVRGDALDGVDAGSTAPTTAVDDPARPGAKPHRRVTSDADEVARQAAALVIALAVTIPLATITVLWSTIGGADDLNRSVVAAPFDLVLVLTLVWGLTHLRAVRDLFGPPALAIAGGAFAVVFAVSLATSFDWLGLALALRLAAGITVIAAVSTACSRSGPRLAVLGTITGVGVLQAVLAMAQSARGRAFGIDYLDFAGKLYPFGSSFAGRGGLTHPYHLAVLLVVAEGAALLAYRGAAGRGERSRWIWVAGIAVLAAGLGVTYSRAAVVGQVILLVAAVAGRDRRVLLPVAGAVLVGLLVGGAAFGDGWISKTERTTNAAEVDSNRRVRLSESIELMRSDPLTGVGPGRYVEALARTDRVEYLPAHDLVAHEGAELGIGGYVTVGALLLLLALRAWRGGAWTVAVIGPVVPFLLLDAYPYVFATGLALSAVWLGLVRVSLRPEPT